MKKLIALLLTLVMVFAMAACGQQAAEPTPAPEAEGTVQNETVEFPEMTLTYSVNYAESNVYADGDKLMVDYIKEATGGKVNIEVYYSSSFVSQDQEIASMMAGDLDMAASGCSWVAEYVPWVNTLNSAFVFNNYDHWYEFYFNSDVWKTYSDDIADTCNVRFLSAANNGSRCVNLTYDKKVTCRADLEGVKLRMPTAESWVFMGEALGSNPIAVPYPDLYLALQQGTVEGQDNPIAAVKDQSFYEVTKCVTLTQHYIADQWITIREDLWESFSPELQQIFKDGADKACNYVIDTCHAQEADTIAFLEDNGLKVYTLTDEEVANFKKEVVDYYLADTEVTASWDMDLLQAINELA